MPILTANQQRAVDLFADGKSRSVSDVAAGLGISISSTYNIIGPLIRLRIIDSDCCKPATLAKGPNYAAKIEQLPGVVVYDCDKMPINRNHDQIGTSRTYDRRPGGAVS